MIIHDGGEEPIDLRARLGRDQVIWLHGFSANIVVNGKKSRSVDWEYPLSIDEAAEIISVLRGMSSLAICEEFWFERLTKHGRTWFHFERKDMDNYLFRMESYEAIALQLVLEKLVAEAMTDKTKVRLS